MAEAAKLLAMLEAGADIAIGSRSMRSELQTTRQSLARQGPGRAFNLQSAAANGSRPGLPRYTIGLQGVSSKRPENGFFSTKDRTLGALTRKFYSLVSKWLRCLGCGDMTLEPESTRWRMDVESVGTGCPGTTVTVLQFLLLSPWRRARRPQTRFGQVLRTEPGSNLGDLDLLRRRLRASPLLKLQAFHKRTACRT